MQPLDSELAAPDSWKKFTIRSNSEFCRFLKFHYKCMELTSVIILTTTSHQKFTITRLKCYKIT